ncbi:MAG: hypothetical protein LBL59_08825 [Xanthomonadaceae bacterium]|jgi:hypothetical protein|nr:hypothetical protein [Xanthomonadaceae bacterium]
MKAETAAITFKTIATSAGAVSIFGLSPWAWVAAIVGAAASYYFEPEQAPDKALRLAFGIAAMAFAAAMVAMILPHLPVIGETAGKIDVEVRAGALGLSVRVLHEQGRRILSGYRLRGGGEREE